MTVSELTRYLLTELFPGLGLLLLVVVVLQAHLVLALRTGLLHLGPNSTDKILV